MNKEEFLQEKSNMKLQKSFNKILLLLSEGEFNIKNIHEQVLGKQIDELNQEEITQRNQVQVNIQITLEKLPGKELNNKQPSIVASEIFGNDPINETNLVKDFLKSRINQVMQDIKQSTVNKETLQYMDQVQDQLLNELLRDNELQQNLDVYYSKLIVDNKQILNDQMAKNYLDTLCVDLFNGVKESVIKSTIEHFPEVEKEELEKIIELNLQERRQEMKSQVKSMIQQVNEKIIQNHMDSENFENAIQDYLNQTINRLEVSLLKKTTLHSQILDEKIQDYLEHQIQTILTQNIEQQQKHLGISYLNMMKSTYYNALVTEQIGRK